MLLEVLYFVNCINNNIPVIFLKYGDGEYLCMSKAKGANCDNDKYTDKLSSSLINSFKFSFSRQKRLFKKTRH
jgi:hypothetical protein